MRHIPAFPQEVASTHYVAGVSCVPFKFLEALPGVQRLQLLKALSVSPDMFHPFPFGWQEGGRGEEADAEVGAALGSWVSGTTLCMPSGGEVLLLAHVGACVGACA